MEKPLAIDLYCGLGGWAEGFLGEGYEVIGFDIERHRYPKRSLPESSHVKRPGACIKLGAGRGTDARAGSFSYANECALRDAPLTGGWDEYPGQLVLQDVTTLHGSQFRDAAVIVASPPCQAYSYRAMPWKRAKALPPPDNTLFETCFRIQREASEAAGRYIPMVVENVRGAQKWVGRAKWHFGSYYLWGDVPALMPITIAAQKFNPDGTAHGPGSWFAIADSKNRGAHTHARHLTNQAEHDSVKLGGSWFHGYRIGQGPRNHGSNSVKRKAASAQIAKIPFPLAQHIAKCFKPEANAQIAGLGPTGVSQKAE